MVGKTEYVFFSFLFLANYHTIYFVLLTRHPKPSQHSNIKQCFLYVNLIEINEHSEIRVALKQKYLRDKLAHSIGVP